MTLSKAQIFNITLNILGVSMPLENPNGNDNRAILLNNYYELARDYVLKDHDWNFASTFKALTLCEKPPQFIKYKYCYDYPNDCVFAREIMPYANSEIVEFEVAANVMGNKVINTNLTPAVLRYTRLIENEALYPAEFVMALSWYLAFLSAPSICGNRTIQSDCLNIYTSMLAKAKALNASEGYIKNDNSCSWLDVR